MKRGRGDTLTGGTGDVNPQWLTFNRLTLSAANVYTETSINLPINRFSNPKGKSIIMEILKVQFDMPIIDSNPSATGNIIQSQAVLRPTSSGGVLDPSDPKILAVVDQSSRGAFTAGGSYADLTNDPQVVDLSDGAGHGMLVATDTLFFGAATSNYASAANFYCRILYRFKTVTLEEYIGIVQSQQ